MLTCYSSNKSAISEEYNNLNWKPVDNMPAELWLLFYMYAMTELLTPGSVVSLHFAIYPLPVYPLQRASHLLQSV